MLHNHSSKLIDGPKGQGHYLSAKAYATCMTTIAQILFRFFLYMINYQKINHLHLRIRILFKLYINSTTGRFITDGHRTMVDRIQPAILCIIFQTDILYFNDHRQGFPEWSLSRTRKDIALGEGIPPPASLKVKVIQWPYIHTLQYEIYWIFLQHI